MTDLDTLTGIASRDPDGGDVEPTDGDYTVFETWICETYGHETMDVYYNRNWREGSHI